MFNTTHNRNRSGQFAHADREAMTAEQRKDHQQATSELMKRNAATVPVVIVHANVDRRAQEIETLKVRLAATKNPINRGIYEAEIARLSR